MAKVIKYNLCTVVKIETDEGLQCEEVLYPVTMDWNEANEEIARREAYKGEYTIDYDGVYTYPIAPNNILEGDYVTIGGVLYKAIANIPNGEPVIAGQNAIETTIEAQLRELKGE